MYVLYQSASQVTIMFLTIITATLTTDQKSLNVEIERVREGLKPKVSKLHKMEGMVIDKVYTIYGTYG